MLLLEAVEPNDGIVQFPVMILGETEKSDGVPYHFTIRWGKKDCPFAFVREVEEALEGIDITPPKITHWSPQIFGEDKKFFVLVSPHVSENLMAIKEAIDPIFGEDKFQPYKPHVTVDEAVWKQVKENYLSPEDMGVRVGNLECRMGNELLKTFGMTVDNYGMPNG